MRQTSGQSLQYLQFPSLQNPDLSHAVFTRKGGTSPAPWDSLNFGGTVGDDQARVLQNQALALNELGLDVNGLHEVWQVHSGDIVKVEEPSSADAYAQADGMVTDLPGIALLMRFADCVPILAYDPENRAVGMAHAGWQGTLRLAAANLVRRMAAEFGTVPLSLKMAIGPSIGPDHYPIGPEVVSRVRKQFGQQADAYLHPVQDRLHFDLWAANEDQLKSEGVRAENIENLRICTACNLTDWYSHRGEHGATGRFGVVISLHE
jgi:YfiH family protein